MWCNDIVIGLTLSLEAPLKFTINMRGLKTNDIYPTRAMKILSSINTLRFVIYSFASFCLFIRSTFEFRSMINAYSAIRHIRSNEPWIASISPTPHTQQWTQNFLNITNA